MAPKSALIGSRQVRLHGGMAAKNLALDVEPPSWYIRRNPYVCGHGLDALAAVQECSGGKPSHSFVRPKLIQMGVPVGGLVDACLVAAVAFIRSRCGY